MSEALQSLDEAQKFSRPIRNSFDEAGILVVDKPAGLTSMDVIRVLRRIVRAKRIGHGGTLDPFATGVLPILFNSATKLSADVMAGHKEYRGILYLGLSYDTQDMTGTPLHEEKAIDPSLTTEAMQILADSFVGEIQQKPPMYSAVKRDGKPLYEYARAGEVVEVNTRPVNVTQFRITERLSERRFQFYVSCSKGTYVRTLIHDLGQKLGCSAVTESLTRTQAGPFHIDEAVQLSTLRYVSDIQNHLKTVREMNKIRPV